MTTLSRRAMSARLGIAALGVGILSVVGAGAAVAATEDTIEVSVQIEPDAEPGALALTVAGDSVALTEGEPVGTDRVFTGTLPTVTVTDTRQASDVPAGTSWYVLGSISDFVSEGEQPDITAAEAFGWYPALLSGDGTNQIVAEGDPVPPGTENGFADEEFLASAADAAAAAGGTYTANAGLELRTPNTVAPGSYSATMTLSLFEG
jgi:hypothetical protein